MSLASVDISSCLRFFDLLVSVFVLPVSSLFFDGSFADSLFLVLLLLILFF